jgi:hypothetical protein
LTIKYVVFKDDDVGKDFEELRKWIDIVLKNNVKAAIGLIGKYMKNQELRDFLNSLNKEKIEIFCHGYSHSRLPFLLRKMNLKNRFYSVEFDRDFKSHNRSLKKYRQDENKYMNKKTITFGPPGNIWNDTVINAVLKNDFKLMFSWRKANHDLLTIPLSDNLKQNSLKEFIKAYEKNKNHQIYTLQFHHASLSKKQLKVMTEVIDFLKNNEDRVFVTPSELLKISKNNVPIYNLMAPENIR